MLELLLCDVLHPARMIGVKRHKPDAESQSSVRAKLATKKLVRKTIQPAHQTDTIFERHRGLQFWGRVIGQLDCLASPLTAPATGPAIPCPHSLTAVFDALKTRVTISLLRDLFDVQSFSSRKTVHESLLWALLGKSASQAMLINPSAFRKKAAALQLADFVRFEHLPALERATKIFFEKTFVRHDCVFFHGCPSRPVAESIAKRGFVLAGEHLADTCYTRGVAHGELLGPGIYVSPDIRKSLQYSFRDGNGFALLVVVAASAMAKNVRCSYPHPVYGARTNQTSNTNREVCFGDAADVCPLLFCYVKLPADMVDSVRMGEEDLRQSRENVVEAERFVVKQGLVESKTSGSVGGRGDEKRVHQAAKVVLASGEDAYLGKEELREKYGDSDLPAPRRVQDSVVKAAVYGGEQEERGEAKKAGQLQRGQVAGAKAAGTGWMDPKLQREAEANLKKRLEDALVVEFQALENPTPEDKNDPVRCRPASDERTGDPTNLTNPAEDRAWRPNLLANQSTHFQQKANLALPQTDIDTLTTRSGPRSGTFYKINICPQVLSIVGASASENAMETALDSRRFFGLGLEKRLGGDDQFAPYENVGNGWTAGFGTENTVLERMDAGAHASNVVRKNPVLVEADRLLREQGSPSRIQRKRYVIMFDVSCPWKLGGVEHALGALLSRIEDLAEVSVVAFGQRQGQGSLSKGAGYQACSASELRGFEPMTAGSKVVDLERVVRPRATSVAVATSTPVSSGRSGEQAATLNADLDHAPLTFESALPVVGAQISQRCTSLVKNYREICFAAVENLHKRGFNFKFTGIQFRARATPPTPVRGDMDVTSMVDQAVQDYFQRLEFGCLLFSPLRFVQEAVSNRAFQSALDEFSRNLAMDRDRSVVPQIISGGKINFRFYPVVLNAAADAQLEKKFEEEEAARKAVAKTAVEEEGASKNRNKARAHARQDLLKAPTKTAKKGVVHVTPSEKKTQNSTANTCSVERLSPLSLRMAFASYLKDSLSNSAGANWYTRALYMVDLDDADFEQHAFSEQLAHLVSDLNQTDPMLYQPMQVGLHSVVVVHTLL